EKVVVVIGTDGSQRQELLADVARIEIGPSSLTLMSAGGTNETFDYSAIDRVLIGAEWNAVKQLTTEGEIAVWPTVTTDIVNISGLNEGDAVTVFDLKGSTVVKASATEGLTTVNLAGLPAGLYVVTANNKSVKIIKN
ncbi:MAG: T9SS type A sorting domain-containing protein, partial [Duncaniella sp.]|nr:T9SS type A sorting domain-containing protein [Duncaniella sp.]